PSRNLTCWNRLFTTSSGVSAMRPTSSRQQSGTSTADSRTECHDTASLRLVSRDARSVVARIARSDHPREVEQPARDELHADEDDDEAQIEGHTAEAQRRDEAADQLDGRVRQCEHELAEDQHETGGPPVAGEDLDEVDDDPGQEHEDIEVQQGPGEVEEGAEHGVTFSRSMDERRRCPPVAVRRRCCTSDSSRTA